jgi:hypothetical protein
MIYTKGKAGYYMGNTDIVTAPLSDANEKNTTEHSTIFDDVFRTIAQKMSSSRLSESEILILFIGLLLSFHAVCICIGICIRRRNRFFYEMPVLAEKCASIISI